MPPRMPKIICTKNGGLTSPRSSEMREVVEVADVVAFVLELGAVVLAQQLAGCVAMSRKVLRKMKSSVPRRYGFSQSNFHVLVAVGQRMDGEVHRAHVERAHLGLGDAAARRGAPRRVMFRPPPVVMLITASVACLIRGRNCMNTSGSGVGAAVCGSRACRCRIDAPGLGRRDRLVGDLVRRDRAARPTWSGVWMRAGDGAGDDRFRLAGWFGHGSVLPGDRE